MPFSLWFQLLLFSAWHINVAWGAFIPSLVSAMASVCTQLTHKQTKIAALKTKPLLKSCRSLSTAASSAPCAMLGTKLELHSSSGSTEKVPHSLFVACLNPYH